MPSLPALHARTPALHALEPRGLPARRVAYWRRDSDSVPLARIERLDRSPAGHLREAWDPRLSIPSLRIASSLSGERLRVEHVDAGWRLSLQGAAMEVRHEWDARGVERRFVYDEQRRPLEVHEGLGVFRCTDRFTYGLDSTANTAGRLVRHEDTAGSLHTTGYGLQGDTLAERRRFLRTLDPPDWPTEASAIDALLEADTFITCWRSDVLGHPYWQMDAGGHQRRRAVDVAGQPLSLHLALAGGAEQVLSSGVVHDASVHVIARKDSEVETVARFREGDGRQVGMRREAGGHVLQDLTYDYDGVGNVLSVDDAAPSTGWFDPGDTDPVQRFAYDTLDQLIEASGRESPSVDGGLERPPPLIAGMPGDNRLRNYVERYEYDAGGNLVRLDHDAAGGDYVRDFDVPLDSNRARFIAAGYTASYDAGGNLLEAKPGMPLIWDIRGYLARAGAEAGLHEDHRYDSRGIRVRKRSGNADVRYLPEWERHAVEGSEPVDVLHLVHAEAAIRVVHRRGADPGKPVVRIQIADILHSVTLETSADGEILSEEAFHPYGSSARWAARDAAHADAKLRRYGGKESDASQLSYYGYRYYAPWLARWISPDPAGDIDGLNRYRFARGNPGSGIDRDGRTFGRLGKSIRYRIGDMVLARYNRSTLATGHAAAHDYLIDAPDQSGQVLHLDMVTELSLRTANHALNALHRAPEETVRPIVAAHLGLKELTDHQWSESRHQLMQGMTRIRADLEDLRREGNRRIVLLSDLGPSRANTAAFVSRVDRHRRVFLHQPMLLKMGAHLRGTLIHELSHLLPSKIRTFDLDYFFQPDAPGWATKFVPPSSAGSTDFSPLAQAVRAIGPAYRTMSTDERKRQLLLRSADTVSALMIVLARDVPDDMR